MAGQDRRRRFNRCIPHDLGRRLGIDREGLREISGTWSPRVAGVLYPYFGYPLVLWLMGTVIGGLVVAMYLPIFKLGQVV